jgi:DnaJ like chaperone protein
MKWTGKIVGFLIGWLTGGPFIAVLGLVIGHAFDQGFSLTQLAQTPKTQKQTQAAFLKASFSTMGYIAKSDGWVSEEEIQQARFMMQKMGLNAQQKREAIHYFTAGKQPSFNLEDTLSQLQDACQHNKNSLRLFIEVQFETATIKGQISPEKRRILNDLCQYLGFTQFDFSVFDHFSRAHQHYQRRRYQAEPEKPKATMHDAYQMLGLTSHASDAEIKKAYRRLMSQHHPDKLIAKGLSEAMIKIATEKTQEIKSAYEQICKARGIK